jgi:hypothetical protein
VAGAAGCWEFDLNVGTVSLQCASVRYQAVIGLYEVLGRRWVRISAILVPALLET